MKLQASEVLEALNISEANYRMLTKHAVTTHVRVRCTQPHPKYSRDTCDLEMALHNLEAHLRNEHNITVCTCEGCPGNIVNQYKQTTNNTTTTKEN